ncbi:hypothetical protein PORCAN_832 [Porphyromonas crevioricanis JCM 13913]|nr:hypothetical protein PORCAN_832 [Porphyromonas crevioricanis JCM 13913]
MALSLFALGQSENFLLFSERRLSLFQLKTQFHAKQRF